MPSVDPASVRGARSLLFWGGVVAAPVAALMILFADGDGGLRIAAVVAVLAVVVIGLSGTLRGGMASLDRVEEAIFDESDALREDLREDIKTAVRAVHKSLVEKQHGSAGEVADLRARITHLETGPPAAAPEPPPQARADRPGDDQPESEQPRYEVPAMIEQQRDGDWQYANDLQGSARRDPVNDRGRSGAAGSRWAETDGRGRPRYGAGYADERDGRWTAEQQWPAERADRGWTGQPADQQRWAADPRADQSRTDQSRADQSWTDQSWAEQPAAPRWTEPPADPRRAADARYADAARWAAEEPAGTRYVPGRTDRAGYGAEAARAAAGHPAAEGWVAGYPDGGYGSAATDGYADPRAALPEGYADPRAAAATDGYADPRAAAATGGYADLQAARTDGYGIPAVTHAADERWPDPRADRRWADDRYTDPRGADPRQPDARHADPRHADPRPAEHRRAEARPADPRYADQRPAADQPADQRWTEPADARYADRAEPAEGRYADRAEPAEGRYAERADAAGYAEPTRYGAARHRAQRYEELSRYTERAAARHAEEEATRYAETAGNPRWTEDRHAEERFAGRYADARYEQRPETRWAEPRGESRWTDARNVQRPAESRSAGSRYAEQSRHAEEARIAEARAAEARAAERSVPSAHNRRDRYADAAARPAGAQPSYRDEARGYAAQGYRAGETW
ncbi:hypothetical protein GCM10010123_29320 [Pilimelia anulata]|uniref:Uncharacterized protein n=1 Tax=Pilimelia anulata TaxID=53371 RepID=A0A8J3B8S1_9ACTN|nr:hypothetical protein [Pilimelia anulata]GGJ97419.1 hypothetical protein GCM10010123_29320 [Pilimelia anulata]